MDELSPLFHDIEFNERFRGYDVEEVDAYVDRVAKAAALVQGRIAELQDRVAAAEAQPRTVVASTPAAPAGELDDARLSRVLVLAQRTADAAIEEAKAEAEAMRIEATTESERVRREADDHASLVLAEAETDRRRMITEAEEAAAGAVAAERARVAAEVAELEQHRAFLTDDIAILEQHLAETRLSIAGSLSALTDLLEAPDAFRAPTMPATSGVDVPEGLIEGRPRPESTPEDESTEPAQAAAVDEIDEVVEAAAVVEADEVVADIEPVPVDAETALIEAVVTDDAAPEAPFDPELAGPINLEPSEPTEVFETIPFEPVADDVVESPAVDMSVDAMPEVEAAPIDTADLQPADPSPVAEVEPVAFETPAEPVLDEPTPVDPFSDDAIAAAGGIDEAPVDAEPAFEIDLVEPEQPEPVVDLTDEPIDLAGADADQPSAEPDVTAGVSSERPDGDAATATAPPRLVTAEDIETASPEEWMDELRNAAEPATDATGQDLLFAPPETPANDHFLDQLRDAVSSEEPEEFGEDALAAFFDDGDDNEKGGWFNRRR